MKNNFCLCVLTIFCLAFVLTGCGGGGGGSSSDYTLSPDELEVATAVEAFAAAVKSENLDQAMQYVFSDLKYFSSNTPSGYVQFKSRLENLFAKAEITEFTITNIGPNMISEDLAEVRARLTLAYNIAGNGLTLGEDIELNLERDNGEWGIIQFSGYNTNMVTAFPPAL